MNKKAIVCCGSRDEEMLEMFVSRWEQLYPDVELFLGQDADDKVTISHGLPVVNIRWGRGVGRSIVSAMLETGGDVVAKLDVDAWHLKNNLFDPFDSDWVMASGHQWQNEPGRFLGIAYAIRREALKVIGFTQSCASMRGTQEDTAISHALRRVYPNGIYLFPFMQCRRADTWNGEDASVIHCGLYGHSKEGRSYAKETMMELMFPRKKEVKETAWVGLSVLPSRMATAENIVDVMNANLVKPYGVVLSIPYKANRINEVYAEEKVNELGKKAIINRLNDFGPITKYIGLCEKVNTDDLCIVIDDDQNYSHQLIGRMVEAYEEGCVLANKSFTLSNTLIPEGYGGVIFRRSLVDLDQLVRLVYLLSVEFPDALLADDSVMGWYFQATGAIVKQHTKPVYRSATEENYDHAALHKIDKGHIPRYRETLHFLNTNRARIIQTMKTNELTTTNSL